VIRNKLRKKAIKVMKPTTFVLVTVPCHAFQEIKDECSNLC